MLVSAAWKTEVWTTQWNSLKITPPGCSPMGSVEQEELCRPQDWQGKSPWDEAAPFAPRDSPFLATSVLTTLLWSHAQVIKCFLYRVLQVPERKESLLSQKGLPICLKTYARSRRYCQRLIVTTCQHWFQGPWWSYGAVKGFFPKRKSRLETNT